MNIYYNKKNITLNKNPETKQNVTINNNIFVYDYLNRKEIKEEENNTLEIGKLEIYEHDFLVPIICFLELKTVL